MNKLFSAVLLLALLGASHAAVTSVACTWTAGALTNTLCQDKNSPGKCWPTTATANFATCTSDGTTVTGVTARSGFFIGATATADATACLAGCAVCTTALIAGCTTVADGYVKNAAGDALVQCTEANAKACTAAAADVATSCLDGYFPDATPITSCTACEVGCKTCTAATTAGCSVLFPGYFATGTAGAWSAITPCGNSFATTCTSATLDTACKAGYGLPATATATAAQCAACPDNTVECAAGKSTKCSALFFLDKAAGTCGTTCGGKCKTCKEDNNAFCLTCDPLLFRGIFMNPEVPATTVAPITAAIPAWDSCECQADYLADTTAGTCVAARTPTATCKKGKKNCKTCWSKPSAKVIKSNKTKIPKLKTAWKKMCKTAKTGYAIFKKTGAIYKVADTKIGAATPVAATSSVRILAASSNILAMTVAVVLSLAVILF